MKVTDWPTAIWTRLGVTAPAELMTMVAPLTAAGALGAVGAPELDPPHAPTTAR
jgi:hypothetical protein